MKELRYYMTVDGQPDKDRQKLMRNLRVRPAKKGFYMGLVAGVLTRSDTNLAV